MEYRIPLFDLNFDKAEEQAVLDTLRSRWISTGPKNMEFENKFASMMGAKYAVALSNCTVALHLALKIAGIKKGDEVICPSLTFVATVNAIRYVDAIPVFCDVKSLEDLTIDTDMIESLITENTKAILVMHYGGFPCNMSKVIELANKYNLKVIEDAAHSPLSEFEGRKLGTFGDLGCFSFFSNKNISTGEGGMLITNNVDYYNEARLLRSHGMTTLSYDRAQGHSTEYDVVQLGYNYRMDDIRAAIGIVQLEKLAEDIRKRMEIRNYYIDKIAQIENIVIPFRSHIGKVSNYIFPLIVKNSNKKIRDRIRNTLQVSGIQTSVHYPAVHKFSIYSNYKTKLPITEYISDNEITLPLFSRLKKKELDYILTTLRNSLT